MARRSLRPHLNQIRTWVRQGRTDAWIAHQLEVTVQQIEAFKRENELTPEGDGNGAAVGVDFDDEIDLRAEDDALIAAELEAEAARRAEEDEEPAEDEDEDSDERSAASEPPVHPDEDDVDDADLPERPSRKRTPVGRR
jgi:hypothetical protein